METTKKICFLLLFISSLSYSQDYYFEVVFKDKGNAFSLADASQFLSASSLEKKAKREVSVDFNDIPVDTSYLTAVNQQGVAVVKHSKWRNSALVFVSDTTLIAPLRNLSFVRSVTLFTQLKAGTKKTDLKFNAEEEWYAHPYGKSLNQVTMLNGHFLHERGFTGEGMDIAVFDAGFPKIFPAVTLLDDRHQIKNTFDFIDGDTSVFEKDKHGAMVLSVLASNDMYMYGAAPKANYHLFITEDDASESLLEEYNWLMAAEMADSIGVDVVTSSLGYTQFDDTTTSHTYADMDGKTTIVTKAANMLFRKGVFVVASAGNEGAKPWHFIGAPADGDSVLAVGSVDGNKNYSYLFSSTGPSFDGDVKPNVSAQGQLTLIAHLLNGYIAASGTSFSGPLVAGLSTCYWQAFPNLKNWELKNEIEQNASQYNSPDSLLGFGLPDYMKMYMKARPGDEYTYGQSFLMSLRSNPFTDHIGIELYSAKAQNVKFVLIDVNGKVICDQTKSVQENQYLIFGLEDLQNISSGMYFLRVYGENGEWMTRKVIKD